MKKYRVLVKIIVLASVLGLVMVTGAMAIDAITGVVQKNSDGQIIINVEPEGSVYLVEGQDLSNMIGSVVRVTGTVSEQGETKTFTVQSMEEVRDVPGKRDQPFPPTQ